MSNPFLELSQQIAELKDMLQQVISQSTQNSQSPEDAVLSREEVMQYLQISASTLWRWEKHGKIHSVGIGSKRYFKKSEIHSCLIQKK